MSRRKGQVDRTPRRLRTDTPGRRDRTRAEKAQDLAIAKARAKSERTNAEIRELKALRERMSYELARGLLHSVGECEQQQLSKISVIKRRLLGVSRLAPQLVGRDVREISSLLDEWMRDIIRSFANGR